MLHRALIRMAGVAALACSALGGEPVKFAESARFDISASAEVKVLANGRTVEGGATIGRMNWVPEAERPRSYTVSFPVSYRAWRAAAVQFTPERSGVVTITLLGPYEEAEKGVIVKQEVLWDDVRIEGIPPGDGGFEQPQLAGAGWTWHGPGVVTLQAADVPAPEGTHDARTWHNQPLRTRLAVTAGRPVTIRLSARAARPEGFVEMKRIASHSTPAHRAARRFLRRVNLGNGLEAPPGQNWGVHYTPDDLRQIRAEGFDHARIPAGWHHYAGPGLEFRIRPEFFTRIDELVAPALKSGLGVIINIHHFDDFTANPKAQKAKFLAIWSQVAAHYAEAGEGLAFELLNEPKDAATTDVMNPIFAEAIAGIREADRDRTIIVDPGRWNNVDELIWLRLPDDDLNLIVTVHGYEPFLFTHQGATWAGPDTKVTGLIFPGPPHTRLVPDPTLKLNKWVVDWIERYNTEATAANPCGPPIVQAAIDKAKEWSDYYGRPIHFGRFGCLATADAASRANYYRTFREAAEGAGVGWAMWDWKALFRYWDEKAARPEPGMREVLFGRAVTRTNQ